jgi:hypothetical protein
MIGSKNHRFKEAQLAKAIQKKAKKKDLTRKKKPAETKNI